MVDQDLTLNQIRYCYKCVTEKPLFEFSKCYQNTCSICRKLQEKERSLIRSKLSSKKITTEMRRSARLKMLKNPVHILRLTVRRRLKDFMRRKNWTKTSSYSSSVGCTFLELKEHIEKQFKPGMSWDNRREWHLDHIIPLSSANTYEEMIKLNHYTNLQPLWPKENIIKGNRIAA